MSAMVVPDLVVAAAVDTHSDTTGDENNKDAELMGRADEKLAVEQYLEAAKWLRRVQDTSLLTARHEQVMEIAAVMNSLLHGELAELPEDSEWKKQGECHSKYDLAVHYKVDKSNQLTFRIDLVLESSLIVPILSVLNETDLYTSWMPNWKHPRIGVQRSVKLHDMGGRGNQIVLVAVDMPFPFKTREVVQHALAIDAIDQEAAILVRSRSIDAVDYYNSYGERVEIPHAEKGVVRIDFEGAMAVRACPADHPVLKKSKRVYPAEPKVLLSIKKHIDAHVSMVPLSIINFFTRHVMKQMIIALVQVADDVRSGKRAEHKEAIEKNHELYDWIQQRVDVLCAKLS